MIAPLSNVAALRLSTLAVNVWQSSFADATEVVSGGSVFASGRKQDSLLERLLKSCLKLQVENLIPFRLTCRWMTNLHLLALSVTVNKTDGNWGTWTESWIHNKYLHCLDEQVKRRQISQGYMHTCGYLLFGKRAVCGLREVSVFWVSEKCS